MKFKLMLFVCVISPLQVVAEADRGILEAHNNNREDQMLKQKWQDMLGRRLPQSKTTQ